jgi:proline iminopeptidase
VKVSVEGAELHYSARGQGPACLVLSAIGTGPYERLTPRPLSDRLRLVYVDLRGGGQSTGDPAGLSFDVLAADLEAIREDLGVEKVAVLGHSILGMLAIEYGRRCPGTVSHVIAVGTPPSGDMARLSADAAAFFEEDASEDRKRVIRDNLAGLPPGASPGRILLAHTPMRFFDARFDAAPLYAESQFRPRLLQHILATLAPGWDVTASAGSLRVPILLAHGRFDYTVPWVLWKDVAATLPNATLRVFERSGHQPFFEEPDAFTAAVSHWMGGAASEATPAGVK